MIRRLLLRMLAPALFREHLQDIERQRRYSRKLEEFLDKEESYALYRRSYLVSEGIRWSHCPDHFKTNDARIGLIIFRRNFRYCHCVTVASGTWVFTVSPEGTVSRRFIDHTCNITTDFTP